MFEIQVRDETGNWFRVDEPYKHRHVAVDDAIVLAHEYGVSDGNLRVVPVGAS